MLHTVVFDLGRTLVGFDFTRLDPLLTVDETVMPLLLLFETGKLSPAEFRQRLCALPGADLALPADEAAFNRWWCSVFDTRPQVDPEWLLSLRRHYRLGLLSNTNAIHFQYLQRQHPFLREMDFHVLSYEIGAVKPEPAIFAAVESRAAGRADGIFYLDDIPEYVAAARARGWQAEVFAGEAAARAALVRTAATGR